MKYFFISLTLLLSISSCKQKPQPPKSSTAFEIFNEGVSLNLQSIEEQNKSNWEKSAALNKASIAKFRETFAIDSTYPGIRNVLAHCLYLDKQFVEAISLFEADIRISGESNTAYRELGLCRINMGQVDSGKADIDKAFSLDSSQEIRDITIQDLEDISDFAFSNGQSYKSEGQLEKGKDYQKFSAIVLMLAFEYSKGDKRIGERVLAYAKETGDKKILDHYAKLVSQQTSNQQ